MSIPYEYFGPREAVTIARKFAAAPEPVFDAWINHKVAAKWFFTSKASLAIYDLDVRVGGKYRITRRSKAGVYIAEGEYLELDRPNRLVLTFGMPQFAADYDKLTVTIAPCDDEGGCQLTLKHEGLRPGFQDATLKSWEKMFDALERALHPQSGTRELRQMPNA